VDKYVRFVIRAKSNETTVVLLTSSFCQGYNMTVSLTSPVTGLAQTGLTSPTYTHVADTAPDANGKQFAVTALGGTQTGVVAHSVAAPFTVTFWKPKTSKILGTPNPVTGVVSSVGRNVYKVITRKGVLPLAGQPYQTMLVTTSIEVPAGSDAADPANIRAALSMHFGSVSQLSAGIGDTVISAVL
jgi:hypothetical protein